MSSDGRPPGCPPAGQGGYVVRQGDGMSSIAFAHGFFWQTLWDHPDNAELKATRSHPEVLLPGDRVTIPPLRANEQTCETGRRHVFRRRGVPARLRLLLRDRDGTPLSGRLYKIRVGESSFSGESDANGCIERWVSPSAPRAELTVWMALAGFPATQTWVFAIGNIDPIETTTGIQARLSNLSFPCLEEKGTFGPITCAALRAFQAHEGLTVTGEADETTRATLAKAYGA